MPFLDWFGVFGGTGTPTGGGGQNQQTMAGIVDQQQTQQQAMGTMGGAQQTFVQATQVQMNTQATNWAHQAVITNNGFGGANYEIRTEQYIPQYHRRMPDAIEALNDFSSDLAGNGLEVVEMVVSERTYNHFQTRIVMTRMWQREDRAEPIVPTHIVINTIMGPVRITKETKQPKFDLSAYMETVE